VLGARLLQAAPLVPLGGNLSLGVAALSYDGQLNIGILADPAACPDAGVLVEGIRQCFAALVRASTPRSEPTTSVPA
jgi:hypothetical protein